MKYIVFLGRSIDGILADLKAYRPEVQDQDVTIVVREQESLQPPAEFDYRKVSEFQPEAEDSYVVIANGGTAQQLVPILLRLERAGRLEEVLDLQRDGVAKLA